MSHKFKSKKLREKEARMNEALFHFKKSPSEGARQNFIESTMDAMHEALFGNPDVPGESN